MLLMGLADVCGRVAVISACCPSDLIFFFLFSQQLHPVPPLTERLVKRALLYQSVSYVNGCLMFQAKSPFGSHIKFWKITFQFVLLKFLFLSYASTTVFCFSDPLGNLFGYQLPEAACSNELNIGVGSGQCVSNFNFISWAVFFGQIT